MNVSFEWDLAKARSNWRKHKVSFEDGISVFSDPFAKIFPDPDHSEDETREIVIGHSTRRGLLLVSFTERHNRIRIISARQATPRERKDYEEGY